MDKGLQDGESAERIAGLMLEDVRNERLARCIDRAKREYRVLSGMKEKYWPSTAAVLSYSDTLDDLYVDIAAIMGINRQEAQRMIEGKDFRAAELAALRIGRGVLDRLGYADTEPQEGDKGQHGEDINGLAQGGVRNPAQRARREDQGSDQSRRRLRGSRQAGEGLQ